jgi:D-serine deaminase-like pyridoxal phosphate-dependent protein
MIPGADGRGVSLPNFEQQRSRAIAPEAASDRYQGLAKALVGCPLPAAVLDLDLLEDNARALLRRAGRLPIRLGTKSIRCIDVLRRVQSISPRFTGLLCYSAREAAWLATQGFDDLVVAYPTTDAADLDCVARQRALGKRIVLMVDDPAQLPPLIARASAFAVVFLVAIDLDCSTVFPNVYFGVRRSPVNTPQYAVALAGAIASHSNRLKLMGLMGYEGQIAGLQDDLPGKAVRNTLLRVLKHSSITDIRKRRCATVAALRSAGFDLDFVNGGGTGSLESTRDDESVTEATAGSGLYAPGLFDHFRHFHHAPSLYFALQVNRCPTDDVVTCLGGGYVASGPAGRDRLPRPFLPPGMKLLNQEGAGEVQTPLSVPPGIRLSIGDPVFFRHAKAGELAERFTHFLLMRAGIVEQRVPTYRGDGQCFF